MIYALDASNGFQDADLSRDPFDHRRIHGESRITREAMETAQSDNAFIKSIEARQVDALIRAKKIL